MRKKYPDTLVVSINSWKDKGGVNTLLNLFKGWDKTKLSQIYTRSDMPQTQACDDFFRIPEIAVIKRTFKPWIKVGGRVHSLQGEMDDEQKAQVDAETKNKLRLHRSQSWLFILIRELIWWFGTWKTKELNQYLKDGKWDVVFCPIYPLIYMNRLQSYVLKKTGLKGVAFIGDDNYSYKSGNGTLLFKVHRYFLRKSIRNVIKECRDIFVMVPKMQKEYDAEFGCKSILLTKGIDYDLIVEPEYKEPNKPMQIVYAGKMIYGRHKSLIAIANALREINKNEIKATLHIYTSDFITPELDYMLNIPNCSVLHESVPYTELQKVLDNADMVTFVESLDPEYRYLARLSFSTKITDYFQSGKCIFAIGSDDIAPIEYLRDKDAAIVCTSYNEIEEHLLDIIIHPTMVKEYAKKAFICGYKYHNAKDVEEKMYNVLSKSII